MTSFEATAAAQAHVGWTQAETDLLRARAAQILQEGRPLREVFEEIARKTGRKSGSVRNYYYAAIRPQLRREMDGFLPAFLPAGPFARCVDGGGPGRIGAPGHHGAGRRG